MTRPVPSTPRGPIRPLRAACPVFVLPFVPLFGLVGALALASFGAMPVSAKDLGVRGQTWAIAEPDLLAQIEARLLDMERSGEIDRLQKEARVRARAALEEPARVAGIAPAKAARSWLFDPSIAVGRDLRGADGSMIAAAGTRVDPFAHVALTRDLLFIDGTRASEVAWALAHDGPSKIVLLAGRPLDLARRHGRPFFFDQGGRLAARLGLAATPSRVTRDGAHLRIDEIPLDDRADDRAAAGGCAATGPETAGNTPQPNGRNEPC